MLEWSTDFRNEKLPESITINNSVYRLQMTSIPLRYTLNYVGFESIFDDYTTIAVQSFSNNLDEAVDQMVEKLKKRGLM